MPAHPHARPGLRSSLLCSSQVPIVPIVMSSYQDFYSKKERRFTSGEFTRTDASGQGVARKHMGGCGMSLRQGDLRGTVKLVYAELD